MPRSFIVAPLPVEHIDRAFPVVQPLRPAMTLAQWHAMAAPFVQAGLPPEPDRGILACRMGTGHIRGLFCYALHDAGVLMIGPFAVAGLFDTRATAAGLIEAIDQLARRLGAARIVVESNACAAASVRLCDLPALFLEHGYCENGDTLVRNAVDAGPVASGATA